VELGVLGPLQVRHDGTPVEIPGAKPRAILTLLGLHNGSVVSADTLVELLWGEDPPRTAAKALQTHISLLRRTLGDGFVLTQGAGWTLAGAEVDASTYKAAARLGRDAAAAGETSQAVARFEEALALWRGIPELPDGRRGTSEKTRWIEGHAALVEDRADALLATGRAAEVIGELEAAVADAPLRERRWGQLMLALYRAGRQGDALGAYQRARSLLADELGVEPGPELRRLQAAIVAQDGALESPAAQHLSASTRTVTFLLTDIEGSTAAWEADPDAMAVALARHDELVEQVVTSRGGRLIKTRGEGDATFSVFERASAAAAAALELQGAIGQEPWLLRVPMRVRVALHTGEVELRGGDYFGRAVNRAARLRSLATGGQILCSGATAELVIDSLADNVVLADLGSRQLRNLARPEHVFELRVENADDHPESDPTVGPVERPGLPAVLAGSGPFVGRGHELDRLSSAWRTVLAGGANAMLIAGEPGVGKTRLAGEWSRQAYDQGALVVYGRCDEDLGAPYQPFTEALRSLVPCLDAGALRGLRGLEALLPMVPGLTDLLPDLAAPTRADPDTERYALFDAVVALLGLASVGAPVVLILDDLHWAAKPTLLLLRHLLRFGEHTRVQVIVTYRSTDLDRSHPLSAMLADLHHDGTASRIQLSGLDEDDVSAYVAEAGYNDDELARALASVTGGNPFFLIEALRHVDESGGRWDPTTLPQGVREAVSRRLSRLAPETNTALAAAAVVGSRFAVELVEGVVGNDLVEAFDEAGKAGIVIEEPGGRYRFNHALVRQSLLAELPSVRRMRLHQQIATTLESQPGADDELLAELAYHYFECAWAGNAAKAVEYCRRAADQAMARLAYEGAADLYDRALHALEDIDDEVPDRADQIAALLIARCEALLAAGDVTSAAGAVSQLQESTLGSARLAAWATCFDSELSMLAHPERLDEIEAAVGAAADKLAQLDDPAGEAKAHTVRAGCLARLGRIGDCEVALDDALTAARRARDHRRVNAVLAQAPLAALWGPNPVPRAGGRCLDVVRLLRITTDSPSVEATSTRCQAVLEAFRGRDAAARRMIDSARRTVTELGLRHALLEVEQFAGIVELIVDEPVAAEAHLRQAYNGFRRMGLDADTAETAALLGRTCLTLDRDAEANELCSESERLAGHALKPSIAWRTLRARLLSRTGAHGDARRVAEAAVGLAERTDLLVDHADACLALATVLGVAGDAAGARAAAERAVGLYERKGAAALAEKAGGVLSERETSPAPAPEMPAVELDNACARVIRRGATAIDREAWDEFEQLFAPEGVVESRRKITGGFARKDFSHSEARRIAEGGALRIRNSVIAVRGERLALARLEIGTADVSPGAPRDEMLQLYGIDQEGLVALQVSFDIEDIDAALAELDAAQTRFEDVHRPAPLENAATRVNDRMGKLFGSGRWDEIGGLFADDLCVVDRRRGLRRESSDRATEVANLRAFADLGIVSISATKLAVRGDRLCLSHVTLHGRDEFDTELLVITEVDTVGLIVSMIALDLDDVDAAYEELDARYLAGEAAPYRNVVQHVMDAVGELNRHEPGPMLGRLGYADRRRVPFGSGEDYGRAIEQLWTLAPDARYWMKAVHALDAHGLVSTLAIEGTDAHGNELQWGRTFLFLSHGSRVEVYEEDEVDAALTRFEELRPQGRRLENAARQTIERYLAHFAARDWDALAEALADDISIDDRRRVVNAGVRHGRDAEIANLRATADAGFTYMSSVVIATRGERLILARASGRGSGSEDFLSEGLGVVEINSRNQIAVIVVFAPDDFEAAIAELDARYLAGEAAPYARTWSVVMQGFASLNRRELPPTTPDWVNIDRRRLGRSIASREMPALLGAAWSRMSDLSNYIEAVHRLDNLGSVVTHVTNETSQEGFHAEWRVISLITLSGDMFNRCEVFDEADIDDAIARFDQLNRPAPRLQNTASRVAERFSMQFAARDWDAIAQTLANDISTDDRRRVVGAGVRRGRDAVCAELSAVTEIGVEGTTSENIAARGEHLVLARARTWGCDPRPEAFLTEMLSIVEINADERIVALVTFDPDDIDTAVKELDSRYLEGEAAPYAQTWFVIAKACAALSQRDLFATTPGWVNVDHRRGIAFAAGDLTAYIRAAWNLLSDGFFHVETVHRLSAFGAVFTWAGHGIAQEGSAVEYRGINVVTVDGDLINRCELFDEADIDVALARFEDLSPTPSRLENAASKKYEQFLAHFAARDWGPMAQLLADDMSTEDRRRVVNGGVRRGRQVEIADMQALAQIGITSLASEVIAVRGKRLVLSRIRSQEFQADVLNVVEIYADGLIVAVVGLDCDDIDAAYMELDDRYLAGEAATHARTWSVIAGAYSAINRHEVPQLTPDYVNVDHRRIPMIEAGKEAANVLVGWEVTPQFTLRIEAVHRLNNLGAVVTRSSSGTSQEGLDAEWRAVDLLMVEGELLSRCEIFDEADLDAALAKFDQLSGPAAHLENVASQVAERYLAHIAAGDWDAMAEILADGFCSDDRRRVVGAGVRRGRDAVILDMQAIVDLATMNMTSTVVATRGERVVLMRAQYSGRMRGPEGAFLSEVLGVFQIDAGQRIVTATSFDPDDMAAAFEELESRYMAGEAAAHARTWLAVAGAYSALNRHILPAATHDWVNIDHRRLAMIEAGDLTASIRAGWDLALDSSIRVEAVHRLTNLGAVVTWAGHGTSREGLGAESKGLSILTVDGDLISRCELFDEDEINAALARFDELHIQARRLENAASRLDQRLFAHVGARDWGAMAALLTDGYCVEDRRRAVNIGVLRGREAAITSSQTIANLGITLELSDVIATRGERLVLSRARWQWSSPDQRPDDFHTEVLNIVEINADERIAARIWFDPNDIDAAFEELDARYLAGEAAHAPIWSIIVEGYATLNKHELPPATTDWVTVDHRLRASFEAADQTAYIRGAWDLVPDLKIYIEAVHRLSKLHAVVTHAAYGRSQDGLDAEWRMIGLMTIGDGRINRCELFDEADLDTALARFEELLRQPRRLENAATQITERFMAHFAARNWAAITEILAEDSCIDDRRRVVNAGFWGGRDAVIANMRALDEGGANITWTVIATRGKRLALIRICSSNPNARHAEFGIETLGVAEINKDGRFAAHVLFELDDIDAAFEELESRYLTGEAAAHAHTWSVIAGECAAFNRQELPAADWVTIDHRQLAVIDAREGQAAMRGIWEVTPNLSMHIEVVHRLSSRGAVCSYVAFGTSPEGVDAEWPMILLLTVEGDRIGRCEIFDEADLDAALARFDELQPPTRRLENMASRLCHSFFALVENQEWDAMAEILASGCFFEDRRRVVNAGVWHGPDVVIANMGVLAEIEANIKLTVMATRGERLALTRIYSLNRNLRHGEFEVELLSVVEIDADNRIAAQITFDPDDVDAAIEELDRRYFAGEAVAHSHTWSVIARTTAAFNRHELPAFTTDLVYTDHRPLVSIEAVDLAASLRAVWDITSDVSVYIEAVHRLSELGTVVTQVLKGTSQAGFDAEWRLVEIFTVEGDLISRAEIFDEADLDAALARFEELLPLSRRLENAAGRVLKRYCACFSARDWAATVELLADDIVADDRRRVVNAGVRRGRDVQIADLRAAVEVGAETISSSVIATRGERLALAHVRSVNRGMSGEVGAEMLGIAEIDADERIIAGVTFDLDDIDTAFEELDARYLAGEAAAHAHTWSVNSALFAGFNRHELPATTPDWVYIDHRPLVTIEALDLPAIRAIWEQTPDINIYMEAVHRLTHLGAVVTTAAYGTSQEGFDAEWRMIDLFTIEGDLINRCEIFNEADLDAALARFEELHLQARRLE
jgi:DNA-binding SARP family transcriptional activator